MEMVESRVQDVGTCVSIPLGGPIYVPNLVGPLTTVADFKALVREHLKDLEAEICLDSSQACDEDISVDELKIFTEEELVNKAFKEAFTDGEEVDSSLQLSEEHSNAGRKGNLQKRKRRVQNNCATEVSKDKLRKRKRRIRKNCADAKSYMAKVEQLAKIKQKQDEDKAAARLHSFNGSCRIDECAVPSSEKIERMTSLRSMGFATKVKSSNIHEYEAVPDGEVILCVEVYHSIRTSVKTQEFLVLGRQPLTELRDSIYCLTDHVMQKAGQHDPSGYFLIEDVFYNDLRDPSAIDYSKPIFDWLKNSKDNALEKWEFIVSGDLQRKQKALLGDGTIPSFRAVSMNRTFRDLKFRLGAGYLYCHQGDCKHRIVVRDMRLLHPEDVQNWSAYPIVTFQQKLRLRKCSICRIYRATKVTVDDKWAQDNPCYFCDNCYFLLHYSKDGTLLYSGFEVYDYHNDYVLD